MLLIFDKSRDARIIDLEAQHQRGHVLHGGQVKPAVARAPLQVFRPKRLIARVPPDHRHPAECLLRPDVKVQPLELVLECRVFLGLATLARQELLGDGYAQVRVGFRPRLWGGPIILTQCLIDDRQECSILNNSVANLARVVVFRIADRPLTFKVTGADVDR